MSDELKQNSQNTESTIFKGETTEYIEENSTIFTKKSDSPANNKKSTGESKKRVILTVVSLALAVVVFLGIFAIVKFMPETETTSSEAGFGVQMITFDKNNLKSVSIDYSLMKSTFTKHIDNTATSSSTSNYYWEIDNVDNKWVSTGSIEGYVTQFAALTALRSIELSPDIEYGFDKPNLTAIVTTEDGKYDYTLTVGNQIATLGEYYVSLNDRYYVMTTDSVETLLAITTDFANTTLFTAIDSEDVPDYYNQDVLSYFDYINVSGSNFEKDIRIVCNKNDPSYNYYSMIAPYNRFADPEYLDGFFSMFTDGLYASGVYSYTHTDEEMKYYGLDAPVAHLVAKIDDYMIDMKVGAEKNGYYPVLFGKNSPIYMVSTENEAMFFVDSVVEEYVSVLTIGDYITEISSMRFMFSGFDKTIILNHNEDDASDWAPSVDGVDINKTAVQNLYQHIILAAPITTIFEADKNDVTLKIIISYVDGSPDKLLEFTVYEDGARRLVSWVDGEPQGIVTKDRVDSIIENVQKVVKGEVISSPIQ